MWRPSDCKRARFDVINECFQDRGDSILSAFSREPLRTKVQDNLRVSLAIAD